MDHRSHLRELVTPLNSAAYWRELYAPHETPPEIVVVDLRTPLRESALDRLPVPPAA